MSHIMTLAASCGKRIRHQAGYPTIFSLTFGHFAALRVERQSAPKSKTKNGRLASLASNPLVTVPILELWAKWVNS